MDEVTPEMFEQLRRAVLAIAYATVSATDHRGDLVMDRAHLESVTLAIEPLLNGIAAVGPASGSNANGAPACHGLPGERSSSEYTPDEIAIADAVGKLRVDEDGLGWIRGMEPKGVK